MGAKPDRDRISVRHAYSDNGRIQIFTDYNTLIVYVSHMSKTFVALYFVFSIYIVFLLDTLFLPDYLVVK